MRRIILINILIIVVLLGGGGGLYYYFYQQANFITTDDAQVTGQLVPITPQIPGKLTKWAVKVGDKVTQDQVLGEQDNAYAIAQFHMTHPTEKAVPSDVQNAGILSAPIAGTVLQVNPVVEGQTVVPGQQLATVSDLSHLTIVANVQETDLQDVKVGNNVDISIDADPGTKYTGVVSRIGNTTAGMQSLLPTGNASGSYTKVVQRVPVTITFSSDTPSDMKPGMNATVKIHR